MDEKTKGAWIVHHAQKLQHVTGDAGEYENINVAGKMGLLLSSLSATDQSTLSTDQVQALAKASNISVTLELPTLLQKLVDRRLIQQSKTGVDVLGVTTPMVLTHTSQAFDAMGPAAHEHAVLDLAEQVSSSPLEQAPAAQYLGDTYKIAKGDLSDLLAQSEAIGFVDAEELDSTRKLFFNGHLFRRDNIKKVQAVMQSLSADDTRRVAEIDGLLKKSGCVELTQAKQLLGDQLFEKLVAIGMFDANEVSNATETVVYLTRPAAFAKYGEPLVEDAMDLAKALVTCLTYGMNRSSASRGRIVMLPALMNRLIHGFEVGPALAIGEDYRVLELKRVVEIRNDQGRCFMRLLKREIGELALQVLTEGDASEHSLPNFAGAAVTRYAPPEVKRVATRRKQMAQSKRQTATMLQALRTGKR